MCALSWDSNKVIIDKSNFSATNTYYRCSYSDYTYYSNYTPQNWNLLKLNKISSVNMPGPDSELSPQTNTTAAQRQTVADLQS